MVSGWFLVSTQSYYRLFFVCFCCLLLCLCAVKISDLVDSGGGFGGGAPKSERQENTTIIHFRHSRPFRHDISRGVKPQAEPGTESGKRRAQSQDLSSYVEYSPRYDVWWAASRTCLRCATCSMHRLFVSCIMSEMHTPPRDKRDCGRWALGAQVGRM